MSHCSERESSFSSWDFFHSFIRSYSDGVNEMRHRVQRSSVSDRAAAGTDPVLPPEIDVDDAPLNFETSSIE